MTDGESDSDGDPPAGGWTLWQAGQALLPELFDEMTGGKWNQVMLAHHAGRPRGDDIPEDDALDAELAAMESDTPPIEASEFTHAVYMHDLIADAIRYRAKDAKRRAQKRMPAAFAARMQAGDFIAMGIRRDAPLLPPLTVPAHSWGVAVPRVALWTDGSEHRAEDDGSVLLPDGMILDVVRVHRAQLAKPQAVRAELVRAFVQGYAAAAIHASGAPVKRDDDHMRDATQAAVPGSTLDEIRAAYSGLPRDVRNPTPAERNAERGKRRG